MLRGECSLPLPMQRWVSQGIRRVVNGDMLHGRLLAGLTAVLTSVFVMAARIAMSPKRDDSSCDLRERIERSSCFFICTCLISRP